MKPLQVLLHLQKKMKVLELLDNLGIGLLPNLDLKAKRSIKI